MFYFLFLILKFFPFLFISNYFFFHKLILFLRLKKKLNVNTQLIVNFIALAFIIILELLYIYVLHNCYIWIFRSSHRKYSVIKGVLRNFTRFNGKNTCVRVCFLIKSACKFIKKETLAHVFSCDVNFAKFLRTPFLQNTSGQLLL